MERNYIRGMVLPKWHLPVGISAGFGAGIVISFWTVAMISLRWMELITITSALAWRAEIEIESVGSSRFYHVFDQNAPQPGGARGAIRIETPNGSRYLAKSHYSAFSRMWRDSTVDEFRRKRPVLAAAFDGPAENGAETLKSDLERIEQGMLPTLGTGRLADAVAGVAIPAIVSEKGVLYEGITNIVYQIFGRGLVTEFLDHPDPKGIHQIDPVEREYSMALARFTMRNSVVVSALESPHRVTVTAGIFVSVASVIAIALSVTPLAIVKELAVNKNSYLN